MVITCLIKEFEENGHRVCLLEGRDKEIFFLFREVKPVLPPLFDDEITLHFERTHSKKFGSCWCLTKMTTIDGHELPHMGSDKETLSSRRILIHKGNIAEDSAGCFLPGLSANTKPRLRVKDSALALAQLEEEKGNRFLAIRIVGSFKAN